MALARISRKQMAMALKASGLSMADLDAAEVRQGPVKLVARVDLPDGGTLRRERERNGRTARYYVEGGPDFWKAVQAAGGLGFNVRFMR
jgi:hypothetical protein